MLLSTVKITCLREKVRFINHDSEIKAVLVQDRQSRQVNDYVEHDLHYLIYLFIIIIIIIVIIVIIIGFYPVSVLVTNVCSLSTFSKLCQPLKGQLRKTADKNVSQTVLVKE